MTGDLPDWYPLANATDEQIDRWLAADQPPYPEMRAALPCLDTDDQFNAWIEGMRDARARIIEAGILIEVFPGLASLSLPPRRQAGRAAR